jgi:hypothetical protein
MAALPAFPHDFRVTRHRSHSGSVLKIAFVTLALGCSAHAHDPSAPDDPHLWANGKQIDGLVEIAAGDTVTIAPSATIHLGAGAEIRVRGTLSVASPDAHATLLGGTAWKGIVVEGGTLDADGLDVQGADVALAVHAGTARWKHGITVGGEPFNVAKGAAFTADHVSFERAASPSLVNGDLVFTYVDYETTTSDGIIGNDPGATIKIDDSYLHGDGTSDADMIVGSGLASLHVAYTEITKVHCGMHFNAVDSFDIAYVSTHDNGFGLMLHGSNPQTGTRTISETNIYNNGAGIDEDHDTIQGAITVANGYWYNNGASEADNLHQFTGKISVTNMQGTTMISNAGPRAM